MRLVQIDENIGKDPGVNSQNGHQLEIGLLVGRSASNKDCILETIASPNQDDQPPIHTSTTKPGFSLILDSDWVIEHAAQVARLLPGGLTVQGIYLSCPEPLFSSSSQLISRVLLAMKKELKSRVVIDSPLVLHIDSKSKKLTIKECPSGGGASSSQLKPCELKSLPLLSNFTSFECVYNSQIQLIIDNGNLRLRDAVKDAITRETCHILGPALGFYNGRIADNSTPVCDVIDNNNNDKVKVLAIQLVGPISQSFPSTTSSSSGSGSGGAKKSSQKASSSSVLPNSVSMSLNALGALTIQGKLHCRAMVHKREPIGAALEALKQDIKATLISRLDVLVEAADMTAVDASNNNDNNRGSATIEINPPSILSRIDEVSSGGIHIQIPRRIYLANNSISYCDYLMEGEVEQHGVERMRELLGDGIVGQGCIMTSREMMNRVIVGRVGDGGGGIRGGGDSSSKGGGMCSVALVAAVGVAVVAVGVGMSVGW